jgi:hypothetical protein
MRPTGLRRVRFRDPGQVECFLDRELATDHCSSGDISTTIRVFSNTAGARDRDDPMFTPQLDEPQIRSSPPRPVRMLEQVGNKADLHSLATPP